MSDINLLPKELRKREQDELKHAAPPKPPSSFSKPSVLAERLISAEAKDTSWWQKIKSWFNKVPELIPEKSKLESKSASVLTKEEQHPKHKRTAKRFNLNNWFRQFFVSSEPKDHPTASKPVAAAKSEPEVDHKPEHKKVHPKEHGKPTSEPEVPIGVVLNVNLLPVGSQPSKVKPYGKKLLWVAGGALLMVALVYAVFLSLITRQKVEVKKVQAEAKMLTEQVAVLEEEFNELELVSRKMGQIKNITLHRNNWLKFFTNLEQLTLTTVSFSSLVASSNGTIALQAEAFTVADLAQQLQVFQQAEEFIEEVVIGSLTVSESEEGSRSVVTTSFQLQIAIDWLQSP